MADTPAGGAAAPVDDFDAVFATLSNGDDTVAGAAAGAGAGSGTDTVEGGAGTDTAAGGILPDPKDVATGDTIEGGAGTDTIQPGGTDTVAGGQGGDTPKAGTNEPTAADFLREFREAVRKDADKPAPRQEEQAPAEVTPFSAEELELIQQVETEYPDVMRVVEAKATRMAQATVAHIFKQIAPVLEAIGTQTATITTKTHLDTLQSRVPDYAEVVPKVQAWIGQQPGYLKKAYEAVATNGNTDDVVDLIERWRTATGTPKPGAAAAAAGGQKPAPTPPKPTPAKKDLQGLAPVGSKRSGVQADAVANDDYDGAFAAAERELGVAG